MYKINADFSPSFSLSVSSCLWERISLCSSNCPGTHFVAQSDLKFDGSLPASVSKMLRLQVWVTLFSALDWHFVNKISKVWIIEIISVSIFDVILNKCSEKHTAVILESFNSNNKWIAFIYWNICFEVILWFLYWLWKESPLIICVVYVICFGFKQMK